jgi:ubiquinone biosynthesis protein COQ9
MAKASPPASDKIIDAMMRVIARDGWPAATLDAIAREADLAVAEVVAQMGNRFDILAAFGKRCDIAALESAQADGGSQAARDRLFDIIMARFDALADHKMALRALYKASRRDLGLAAFFASRLPKSLSLIASSAGVDTSGLLGMARVKALSMLYIGVVRDWFADDSEDLGKTMASLDKALARAARWESEVGRFCGPRPRHRDAEAPTTPAV